MTRGRMIQAGFSYRGSFSKKESVQAPVGVVEYRPAFEAANLPGRLTASRPDIVDEPLVNAERFRVGDSCLLTDFLNRLGVHWRLHLKGRCLPELRFVARFIHVRYSGQISRETTEHSAP